MAVFIECLAAGINRLALPVEDGRVEWSETVATGAATSSTVQGDNFFITATSDEDGYIAFGKTPDSATNPRHRLKSGISRSFAVKNGDKAHYTAG